MFGHADACGWNMRAQYAVVHQMLDGYAMQKKRRIGDEPAMATPPERFGAHDDSTCGKDLAEQCLQRGGEWGRFHVIGVGAKRRVAKRDVRTRPVNFTKSPKGGFPTI